MSRAQNPREEGHAAGVRCGKKIARIAAFGAIRRAVKEARYYDNLYSLHAEDAKLFAGRSKAIRKAIRAAIGSDKA